nr:reverse transcriptase domain-containing protein [Tanacetum cinerariifolium]
MMEKFESPPDSLPVIIIDPDDQPMWSSARTVSPTPSCAIVQRPISNDFFITGTYMQMIRDIQFDGRILSDPHRHVAYFLKISNLFEYGENQEEAVKLRTFPFLLSKEAKIWLNELNEGTITPGNEMRDTFISRYFSPIQKCMVQKVKALDASLGEKDCSRIVSDKENDQGLENQSKISRDESSRSRNECNDKITSRDDTDIRHFYDTGPMVETDQNDVECDDERVTLANLIVNLKLDIDENKNIQKKLKKANASLTQELKECKSTLVKTSRTLRESNCIWDSCLIAFQNKQTEFEMYKAFNDRTVDYGKLERKLNETLRLLAQKEIDIKEGLKIKACEILVVIKKHDELIKQSLLTKSHYEGHVKEKTKTHNDSFTFVHELKQEMHAELKYVESLENEIDELKSDKA